jgi:transcription antitermination factor NusG
MNSSLLFTCWGKKVAKLLLKGRKKFKEPITNRKWNIVRGDLVQVIEGPQIGEKGKVLHVLRENNRVIIEGVNMVRVI